MQTELRASPPGLMRRLGAAGPVAIALSFWPLLGGFILLAFLTRLGPWLRLQETAGMLIVLGVLANRALRQITPEPGVSR